VTLRANSIAWAMGMHFTKTSSKFGNFDENGNGECHKSYG